MHTHQTVAGLSLVVSSVALVAAWRIVDPLAPPPEDAALLGSAPEPEAPAPAAPEGQVPSERVVTEEAQPAQPSWERVDTLIADILEAGESSEQFAERLGEIMVSHTAEFDAFVGDFIRSGDYRAQPVTCSLIAAIVRHHPEPSRMLDTMALEADEDMAAYLGEAYGVDPVAEVTDEDLDALQGLELADLEDPDFAGERGASTGPGLEELEDLPQEEALVEPVTAQSDLGEVTERSEWVATARVQTAAWAAECPFGSESIR